MSIEELTGQAEAILFASGEPVALDRIAQVLGVRTAAAERMVSALQDKYNTPESGVHLLMLGDSAQFCTNPAFIEPVRAALDLKRNTPLSQAAMEVLAVVAYNQPVTKAFVEQVRGAFRGAGKAGAPRAPAALRNHRELFALLPAGVHRPPAAAPGRG